MGNLEELYNESGIKKTAEGSKTKPGIIKVLVYMAVLGYIIYWAFTTSIFGSNTSQPYYFVVITAVFLYLVLKKVSSFWKQNKKFLKPE